MNYLSYRYSNTFIISIKVLLLCLFLAFTSGLKAQESGDTDFWFVAPDASKTHADRPTFLMISTGDKPANIKISMPANPNFTPVIKTIAARSYYQHKFSTDAEMDMVENSYTSSGTVTQKGIHIESDNRVFVYYQIDGANQNQKELFTFKGEKALGLDFYMPFQKVYQITSTQYDDGFRQIQIVATENDTKVVLHPTDNVAIGTTTSPINSSSDVVARTRTLKKGETLLWRGYTKTSNLTGTRVTSDKPVAVTLFEDCIQQSKDKGSIDPIGDQIVPVNNLGRNYIVVKGFSYNGVTDHVGILAVEDNTVVTYNGTKTTLNAGGYWSTDLGEGAIDPQGYYIQTTKPVYCMHQSAAGSEIGGALLPSLYSISSRSISFMKGTMAINSMFLVFRESAKNNFMMDGETLDIIEGKKVGFDDWMYAKVDLQNTTGVEQFCRVENTVGSFALGYFNGTATSSALYGYLSDFGKFSFSSDTIYHCGSSYPFDAPYALSYKWTLPDKSTSVSSKITATKSGSYILTVNQDPYTLTDETYLKLQNFSHKLTMPVGSAFMGTTYTVGVKLNPQGDKDNIYRATYEWSFGEGANLTTATTADVSGVSWSTSGIKTVTLKVKNLDANCDTTITRQVLVTNSSADISSAECVINPLSINWKPIDKKSSTSSVHMFTQPLVGDIDGDGQVEVVTTNTSSDDLLIFDKELVLKKTIATPVMNTNGISPVALARLTSTDQNALIIIATSDYKLKAYNADGTDAWTSTESIFNSATQSDKTASVSLVVGDINNDGIPEVLAGDRIFNVANGKLIASLPDDNVYGRGYGVLNANASAFMPVLADIDNDGQLDVVGGNTTYKVNIVSTSDATKNAVTVLKQATGVSDGFVSVADIDLDGQLDVVVISSNRSVPTITVWNGVTGETIAGPKTLSTNGVGGSRVSIGNVDADAYPELFFSYEKSIVGFKYNPVATTVAGRLVERSLSSVTNVSGSTPLSMFDFDQDGKSELVYQDGAKLRILNGETGKDIQTFENYTSSQSGYPVIVDFDGDNHADILTLGASTQAESTTNVRLKWLSGEINDWAPARSVWNQYAYNATHVNKDLTIPRYQINPVTAFSGKDGVLGTSDDIRPYNSFLQQQTSLNTDGMPLYLAPNAKIIDESKIRFTYNLETNSVTIHNIYISNVGAATLQAPIKITVYNDNIPSQHQYTYTYNNSIAVGQTHLVSFEIPLFKEWLPVNNLIIRINDKGDGLNYQPVCNSCCVNSTSTAFANIPFDKLAWADSYRQCEGGDVFFDAATLQGTNVTYKWLTPNSELLGTTKNAERQSLKLSDAGKYVFQANNINDKLSVINYPLPYLSVAPPIMYWRADAKDRNWNNLSNWATETKDNIMAIPSACTKVYIPSISANYPSLDIANTDYSIYGNPTVESIVFQYGGELAYQHKLKYNKAYIDYNWGYYENLTTANYGDQPANNMFGVQKKRNTWYMLAAPLKKIASGDFAFAGKPITWQRQFNKINSATGVSVGEFSKPYSTNDIDLSTTNNALAIKVAAYDNTTGTREQGNLESLKGILEIPFFEKAGVDLYSQWFSYDSLSQESTLFYFDTKTLQRINYPTGKIKRGNEAYRFIYETESNEVPLITIGSKTVAGYKKTVTVGESGSSTIMIGNPFLSSINAETFFSANSSVLNNEGYYVFSNETQTWALKTYSANNSIPPYQAYLITLVNNLKTADLLFPLETDLLSSTRSTSTVSTSALRLQLKNSEEVSADYAVLNSGLEDKEDVSKMIFPEGHLTPEAFFVSTEGKGYNLIQAFKNGMSEIGIGVKSSDVKNQMTLSFENTQEFIDQNKVQLILVDKLLKKEQDINSSSTYSFRQETSNLTDQYVDKSRFALRVVYATSGTEIETRSGIEILYIQNRLTIESSNQIDQVYLYDLYGRLLYSDRKIGLNSYSKEYNLPKGAYVVKVITESGISHVAKVLSL